MSESRKAAVVPDKVTIRLPIDPAHPNNRELFVALNGATYLIKRGVDVEVPAGVAEIIEHSHAQQAAAFEYMFSNANGQ